MQSPAELGRGGRQRSPRHGVHRPENVRTSREEAKPAWRSTVAGWHESQSFGHRTTITAGAVAATWRNAFQFGDRRWTLLE